MIINAYITKFDKIIIDKHITLNANNLDTCKVLFEFQLGWPSDLELRALFKRDFKGTKSVIVDNNYATIPSSMLTSKGVLRVGLQGIKFNDDTPFELVNSSNFVRDLIQDSLKNDTKVDIRNYVQKVKNTNYYELMLEDGGM